MRNLTKTGRYISNRIGKAIADYNLIEDKDRILVAVSGGKDSLGLLTLLNERKKWAPVSYELIAMHVETDYRCAGCAHTKVLTGIFEDLGIAYRFEKVRIVDKKRAMTCFWCSWNRRKALFLAADELGCTKVAFGHHMDDIVETLLLNIFYHGEFSAMNPRQDLFGGKLSIIRPLCYVEEEQMKRFAKESKFPAQLCRCPNSAVSKRKVMKDFVHSVGKECAYAKMNVFRSIGRINKEYTQIKSYDGEDESKYMTGGGELHGRESCKGRDQEAEGVPLLRR